MLQKNSEIRLNTDTALLKIVANTAMLIDHLGAVIFTHYPSMRIIGRIAFPIFCWCLTIGAVNTRNPFKYLLRILFFAVVSQPIYCLAMHHVSQAMRNVDFEGNVIFAALEWLRLSVIYKPNILFSIFLGLSMILCIRHKHYIILALLTLSLYFTQGSLTYGWKGIGLMLLFYAFRDRPLDSFIWTAGFMLWWGIGSGSYSLGGVRFSTQTFAVLSLPFIYIPTNTDKKLSKWFSYLFYPAHLAAILFIQKVF